MFFAYLICFGVGLLFTLLSAIFGHVFGGHDGSVDLGQADGGQMDGGTDGHAEAGFGSNDMPGFSPLSPTVIASFVTAFGGFGMVFHHVPSTSHPFVSAALATLGGFGMAYLVFLIFRAIFSRTQSSSEARVADLTGIAATVISPIPANGVGEIAYVQGQTRYNAPAREESGVAVDNGKPVKITRIIGSQFFVKQI